MQYVMSRSYTTCYIPRFPTVGILQLPQRTNEPGERFDTEKGMKQEASIAKKKYHDSHMSTPPQLFFFRPLNGESQCGTVFWTVICQPEQQHCLTDLQI